MIGGAGKKHAVATAHSTRGAGWLVANAPILWVMCALTILVLSLLPASAPESEAQARWLWNYGHIAAYAALATVTALLAVRNGVTTPALQLTLYAALVAFGIGIELLQPIVGREASFRDGLFDLIGVIVGAGIGTLIKNGNARRLRNGIL